MTYNAAAWLVDRHVDSGDGDRLAVICRDERLTYGDLQRQIWRAQHALASLGVHRTDRVVLVMDDEPAFLAWFLGALRSGVVPVPLSTMLTKGELEPIVEDAVARVVVASARHADKSSATVTVAGDDWGDFDDDSEAQVAPTTEDSPGLWLYSSGTTGVPKGVMHRQFSLEATAQAMGATVLDVNSGDRFLAVPKLFFAYGLGNSMTFPFAVGATTILNPEPSSVPGLAALATEHRPTVLAVVPGFVAAMLDSDVPADALSSVRVTTSAGESLPADLHRRFTERFGVPLLDVLGTTEALHCFIGNRPGHERPGTSGQVIAGYDVTLRDEEDHEVTAPETPGYLHVRGPSIAMGYWSRYDATQAAFRGDWLKTGDVYVRSDDDYFTFLGRNTDMIKAGGIWVSPAEVEATLISHPDVLEAAVVGPRDVQGLEQVVAVVVPRAGRMIDPNALETHCRERIAAFKRPRRVVVVEALPKTATGKIRRFQLRDALARGEI
ncbi:MAG TPA: benzoate-CoA ligase family protein [Acidimicrobiales bacterium]|nr:benzoate-CoA ligase family protein [Acidimicrobiales bacterium]